MSLFGKPIPGVTMIDLRYGGQKPQTRTDNEPYETEDPPFDIPRPDGRGIVIDTAGLETYFLTQMLGSLLAEVAADPGVDVSEDCATCGERANCPLRLLAALL